MASQWEWPASLPQFTIPLAHEYSGASEEVCNVALGPALPRYYTSESRAMTAAVYEMTSREGLADTDFGIAVNRWSCNDVPEMIEPILAKLAYILAARFITYSLFPSSPIYKGVVWPYSEDMRTSGDGSNRPRGLCGAVRLLYGFYVPTTEVSVPVYFGHEIPT